MLIDRRQLPWAALAALLLGGAGGLYVTTIPPLGPPRGGTSTGLILGGAAAGLILFAGLLGVRRRVRHLRLGTAAAWLSGHVWLGLAAYGLVWLHAGFHVGGIGSLTAWLMIVFSAIVATGALGIALQQIVPRLMPLALTRDQIGPVIEQLRSSAEEAVASVCGDRGDPSTPPTAATSESLAGSGPLRDAFDETIAPFLLEEASRRHILARRDGRERFFRGLRDATRGAEEKERSLEATTPSPKRRKAETAEQKRARLLACVDSVETRCDERAEVLRHQQAHRILHGWLVIHAPLWGALFVLVIVHAVASLSY